MSSNPGPCYNMFRRYSRDKQFLWSYNEQKLGHKITKYFDSTMVVSVQYQKQGEVKFEQNSWVSSKFRQVSHVTCHEFRLWYSFSGSYDFRAHAARLNQIPLSRGAYNRVKVSSWKCRLLDKYIYCATWVDFRENMKLLKFYLICLNLLS